MKLKYLWVSEFKNLKDFEISFSSDSSYSVLVGRNGTGKSNLLELIVLIFSSIEKKATLNFSFKIEYLCNNSTLRYEYNPNEDSSKTKIYLNKKAITQKAFFNNDNIT